MKDISWHTDGCRACWSKNVEPIHVKTDMFSKADVKHIEIL